MTFEQALTQVKMSATQEDPMVDVVIFFKTSEDGKGTASLTTKRFFKDQKGTMVTVKRAWEYACQTNPDRENSIEAIGVMPTSRHIELRNEKLSA